MQNRIIVAVFVMVVALSVVGISSSVTADAYAPVRANTMPYLDLQMFALTDIQ